MNKKSSRQVGRQKKSIIIAVIVAIALLVVVVVALLLTRNPEKQISNGFASLVEAKTLGVDGSSVVANGAAKTQLDVSGVTDKRVATGTVKFALQAASVPKISGKAQVVVAEDGTPYMKVDEPKKLMSAYAKSILAAVPAASWQAIDPAQREAMETTIATSLAPVGDKLENKWIKLDESASDISGGGDVGCYIAFARKLNENNDARKQLASAFKKSQLFTIKEKLEREGSAQGYRVGINQAKIKDFKDSVASNEAVKALGSCGTDVLTLGATDSINDQTADIWVNRWSSEITRIKYTKPQDAGGTATVDIKFTYDQPVQVTTPTNIVSMKELTSTFGGQESAEATKQ